MQSFSSFINTPSVDFPTQATHNPWREWEDFMKHSLRPRKTATLPEAIQRQLNMYALAASAAGVGILALALPAEAEIVYTPTHQRVTHGGSFKIDLNHDGITDFTLINTFSTTTSTFRSNLSVRPAAGNGAEGWTGFRPYASALKLGGGIGPAHYFPGKQMASVNVGPAAVYYVGSWVNVKNRYLGLRFKIKGQTHYGWARLSVQVQNHTVVGTLTGYAYETVAGKPLKAGQTKEEDAATIQPASLGHLARGASALSAWRGKEPLEAFQRRHYAE
jgi:hypothetical protein